MAEDLGCAERETAVWRIDGVHQGSVSGLVGFSIFINHPDAKSKHEGESGILPSRKNFLIVFAVRCGALS